MTAAAPRTRRRVKAPPFTQFAASLGVTFEGAQSALFRVVFDGEEPASLSGTARESARSLFGDVDEVPPLARDVVVLVKGARIGGTRFSALRIGQLGLSADLSSLAPGELAYCLFCGPDTRLSRQAFRYWVGEVQRDPSLRSRVIGEITKDGMTMRHADGEHLVRYEVLPATRGGSALRARTLVAVLFTEFAYVRDDASGIVNDVALFQAVRPRVIRGGQIVVESTPWIESGVLYELDHDNFGDPTTALVARCPTVLMRDDPRVHAMVAAEEARDPDNASREYGATFIGGGAGVFLDPVSIAHAVDPERPLVSYVREHGAVAFGGDVGLVVNSSALVGAARYGDRFEILEVLEVRPQRGAPLKLSSVIGDYFAPVLTRHSCRGFMADGHVREPAREWTSLHKLSIDDAPGGAEGKAETHLFVQQALREGRVKMAKYPRLEAQLRQIVSRPLSGGGIRISAPTARDGSHGDVASAFVLAIWAASRTSSGGGLLERLRRRHVPGDGDSRYGDGGRGLY